MKDLDINRYLERINYHGSYTPNLETLRKLQRQHILSVPFENLDVCNHIPIELLTPVIFDKIVKQNRGGFCYELNSLFYELLVDLGFDAKMISGRSFDKKNKRYRKDFTHLAIIVHLHNTDYLVDVGYGEFTFAPLEITPNVIQNDERGQFIIDHYSNDLLKVSSLKKNRKMPLFLFGLNSKQLSEFEDMCYVQQISPHSPFTQAKLISLATEKGRVTISGDLLIISDSGVIQRNKIRNKAEYEMILEKIYSTEKIYSSPYELVG